jgi:hypothetical protein
MSEINNNDLSEIVDNMLDGQEDFQDHSQSDTTEEQTAAEKNAAPDEKDFTEDLSDSAQDEKSAEETDGTPPAGDSEPEDKKTDFDAEIAALKAENENWKKRFHDTQKAMHKANTEKSELQKKLNAMLKKADIEDDNDDWFDEADKKDADTQIPDMEEVKKNLKALEQRQNEYQQELRRQQWLDEAKKFAAEHDDFEELVYEKLEPLLDEESGDAMLRALYLQEEDKSPAGAYNFAKKLFDYKEKINSKAAPEPETKEVPKTNQQARGKAGLDRLNSADFPEEKKTYTNVVDEVFG